MFLESTGDRIAEIQKVNDLAMTLYKMHLAASMDDAVKMAEDTLFGASKREAISAQHIDERPIGAMMTPERPGDAEVPSPQATPEQLQEIDASALDEDVIEIPQGDDVILIGGSPITEAVIKPQEPKRDVQTRLVIPDAQSN
ncbi:hypothetical protein HY641_00860 [Candidatus Woesearchaeota archaeon]|nr:hypothetical protein [Candidatus Woesearchaeota archaeon]